MAKAYRKGERLVTLTGPAGTGKTRLARRFLAISVAEGLFERGLFLDLSEARTLEDIMVEAASRLDVASLGGDPSGVVGHAIASRGKALVVLDNFEQITRFALDSVGRWLTLAPEARFLVTSREQLELGSERAFELPPLPLEAATELFVDRARAVRPDFERNAATAADLDELATRLDGMPLAIELAAARIDVLPPKKLIERMSARLDLLKNRRRDMVPRQATLRNALDWSWDLLNDAEREGLAACGVFRGGFSLEAIEAILPPSNAGSAIDLVEALVKKSLVRRYEPPGFAGETRFGLYESIRDYAVEKAGELSVTETYERLHAAYFAAHGEALDRDVETGQSGRPARLLRLECDNVTAAFERMRARDAGLTARAGLSASLALGQSVPAHRQIDILDAVVTAAESSGTTLGDAPLAKAFHQRALARQLSGQPDLARADLESALAVARGRRDDTWVSRCLIALGMMEVEVGRPDAGDRLITEGLSRARASGDRATEAEALRQLATRYFKSNRLDEARTTYEDALTLFRAIGHERNCAAVLGNLGVAHQWQGREQEAEASYVAALAIALDLGDRKEEGIIRTNLGLLYTDQDRLDDAERELARALEIQRLAGHRQFVGNTVGCLAALAQLRGEFSEARRRYAESCAIFREVKERRYEATALRYIGVLALEEGRMDDALLDLAAAARIAEEVGDLQAFVQGALGAALSLAGKIEEATSAFALASKSLAGRGEPRAEALLATMQGFLDVGRAERAAAPSEKDGHLSEAAARVANGRRVSRPGADLRVALRILERETARVSRALPPAVSGRAVPVTSPRKSARKQTRRQIVIGAGVRWFETREGGRVDLSKRRALRLIVQRLAEAREAAPGVGIDVHALVEAGWPNERILTEAATARVYTAVKTLREVGLGEALIRQDDGYLFSTEWEIVRRA